MTYEEAAKRVLGEIGGDDVGGDHVSVMVKRIEGAHSSGGELQRINQYRVWFAIYSESPMVDDTSVSDNLDDAVAKAIAKVREIKAAQNVETFEDRIVEGAEVAGGQ